MGERSAESRPNYTDHDASDALLFPVYPRRPTLSLSKSSMLLSYPFVPDLKQFISIYILLET